jgi:glutamyl-tRNA synthetase
MVKTRFAPSPTGYLHLGGARTALYSWLYARQHQGIFVLRIEDTDTERSTEESTKQIIESMKYLGLDWDEGPILQSERLAIYQEHAKKLVEKGMAYEKEGAIFFKAPTDKDISFDDLIIGKVTTPVKELKDFVILKSNGWPVYHFAVVVDDALMQITHVIRGMDHLSNTTKHIMLFEALGYSLPFFAHIPMILGPDKKRLSKRHGAEAVDKYEKDGILTEGMLNFLARLGWGYENEEVFTPQDLLQKFKLENVSKNAAVFDPHKMIWLNNQHIKNMEIGELIKRLSIFAGKDYSSYKAAILIARDRSKTLAELVKQLSYFDEAPKQFEEEGIKKHMQNPQEVFANLKVLAQELEKIEVFNHENLENAYRKTAEVLNIKAAGLIHPTRLALSGMIVGPGIFELLEVMGKKEVIARLLNFEERFKNV